MANPAKLINPEAGGGWEEIRHLGAARVSDLAIWARGGSITSVLGAVALLGDLTSHAVQAGFAQTPAMHHMVMHTVQRNVVSDNEAIAGFTLHIQTSGIAPGSTLYLLDYTENTYLYTGNAADIDSKGMITIQVGAGDMNSFQNGIHSCIGIIDPPGDTKPIIFEFWYCRDGTIAPPEGLKYDGSADYDGTHDYSEGAL